MHQPRPNHFLHRWQPQQTPVRRGLDQHRSGHYQLFSVFWWFWRWSQQLLHQRSGRYSTGSVNRPITPRRHHLFLWLAIAAVFFIQSRCAADKYSCTYIPQGQVFSACYTFDPEVQTTADDACNSLGGNIITSECSSQDRIIFCAGGSLDKPLSDLGVGSLNLTNFDFALYSGGSDADRNNYCSSDLQGTIVSQ